MRIIFDLKRASFIMSATLLLAVLPVSCNKDDNTDDNKTYNTTGTASGSQVNPPVVTSATATLTGTFNAGSNNWIYNISWNNLSSTATIVEVHGPANPGADGGLLFALPITSSGITGAATGSITLTPQQEIDLGAGLLYYTIINATYVGGEIRAQITATAQ